MTRQTLQGPLLLQIRRARHLMRFQLCTEKKIHVFLMGPENRERHFEILSRLAFRPGLVSGIF